VHARTAVFYGEAARFGANKQIFASFDSPLVILGFCASDPPSTNSSAQ
jgi:hypothetical protein